MIDGGVAQVESFFENPNDSCIAALRYIASLGISEEDTFTADHSVDSQPQKMVPMVVPEVGFVKMFRVA